MTKSLIKKAVSLLLIFTVIFSISSTSFASSESKKTFRIRYSGSYNYANANVTLTTTNNSGTEGTVTLSQNFTFTLPEGGLPIVLHEGTTWDYKISKMKDGAKITLISDYNKGANKAKTDEFSHINLCVAGIAKMTGKIHIDGKAKFGNIWKIDTFTRYSVPNSISPKAWDYGSSLPYTKYGIERPGFYFRDT
ncbi:MAG: hypothetical protein IKE94_02235 [Aeriscardovia sp.]|nr:hypothetical protein [Aeriscardovia sp.]MBR3463027.1 hypothetical protein [Clostridiales bacterium]